MRGHPLASEPPAEPGLCLMSQPSEGTALGAPLAGGERLTHFKVHAWVSDQTTDSKIGNTKGESSKKITPGRECVPGRSAGSEVDPGHPSLSPHGGFLETGLN